ncbi:MAG: hypothetical protein FWH16_02410 [Oscillospiraceae bacterium]|nr:hypothetical protein [Oscillospiraceae bacterium]
MKSIRRLICAALVTAVLAGAPLPAIAADVYHYGVGGAYLFPCTYSYMPMLSAGELMVPVNLLLHSGLGLSSTFSERNDYYTFYYTERPGQYLTFYMNKSGSYDLRWSYNDKSLLRKNGIYYVPLLFVAERLGFNASTFQTRYGTVTRVSLADDTRTDEEVGRMISDGLSGELENYRLANGVQPPEPKAPPNVYLGFDAETDGDISGVLELLGAEGITATFFITPEFAGHVGVRDIIVRGHALGIRLDGGEDLDMLTYTNELLRLSALTQTRLLLLPEDTRLKYDILETVGYRLWQWELDGHSPNIFRTIDNARNASYVRFGCDDESVEALNELLGQLKTLDTEYYAVSEAQPPPEWSS